MSTRHESTEEPPAIRQKTAEIEKDKDFWFPKGDFIIIADQSKAFRIHGDILARKSKVFSDLFSLAETPRPDFEDTMDGCPVVHVTDTPSDFCIFLGLIHDGFQYHQQQIPTTPLWFTVRVMIQLGDKYDTQWMREEGLSKLRSWYSPNIDKWDQRKPDFFLTEEDHLEVANLIQTVDDPDLYAAVLYHCCRLTPSRLTSGLFNPDHRTLCFDDLCCVFNFREHAASYFTELVNGLPTGEGFDKSYSCTNCHSVFNVYLAQAKLALYLEDDASRSAKYSFLDRWVADEVVDSLRVCKKCQARCQKVMRRLRQGYRDKLVEYFKSSDYSTQLTL